MLPGGGMAIRAKPQPGQSITSRPAVIGPVQCNGRTRVVAHAIVDPTHLVDVVTSVAVHLPLGYEPVAAPCSLMKCGDVLHRSTLDMVLRGEQVGPDWRTFVLLATVGAFLFAPPGIVPGAIDYYILSRLKNMSGPQYGKDDIVLGRKLATGGFGTVFRGELKQTDGKMLPVVVKKATEFGQAEAWMNERTQRLPGKPAAEFITAFDEEQPGDVVPQGKKLGAVGEGIVWLVWKYEGDNTLSKVMESKEFPYNLERMLLKRQLRLPKGVQRQAVTIRLAFKQLLEALAALHITGIVHRDIKPQNCIVSDEDRKIKLIDLGAAADLRVGINYAPSEYLLDPRYAPPQQYIMSTQTPKPPPAPVAALLSPILWRMEHPDRFDMWSCGVTLMQMCFPSLRNDNNLIAFNKKLQALGYDLRKWRAEVQAKGMNKDTADGFALLDLDDGAGWNLLCDLMAFKPTDRCTAAEALQSRFFADPPPAVAASRTAFNTATKAINKTLDSEMFSSFASSATGEDRGSLTEAQLRQELGLDDTPTQAPMASNTIVWWKERQNQMRKSIEKREGSQGTREAGLPMKGTSPGKNGNGVDRAGKNGNGVDRGVSPPAAPAPVAPPAAKAGGFAAMISGQWAKDIRASMDRFSMDGDDDEKPKQKPKVPGPEDYRGVESVDVDPEPEEVEVVMAGQPAAAGRFGFLGNMLRKPDAVKK